MPYTLSDLLQGAYRDMGGDRTTKATGGSTSTCVIGNLANELTDDDVLNNGTVFVVRDAGGASAAPEGQFSRIASFDSATSTITLADTLSAAIASADTVQVTSGEYPLEQMIELANDALEMLGKLPLIATLTTVTGQHEYTLAEAYAYRKPTRVQYQPEPSTDTWVDIHDYYKTVTAPGSAPVLVLPELPSALTVRVWYEGSHPKVTTYNSVISPSYDPNLCRAALRVKAIMWRIRSSSGGNDFLVQDARQAQADFDTAWAKFAPDRPKKPQTFIGW